MLGLLGEEAVLVRRGEEVLGGRVCKFWLRLRLNSFPAPRAVFFQIHEQDQLREEKLLQLPEWQLQ